MIAVVAGLRHFVYLELLSWTHGQLAVALHQWGEPTFNPFLKSKDELIAFILDAMGLE